VLRWPGLDAAGAVDAVVTTRLGGVSQGSHATLNLGLHVGDDPQAVIENRRRAAAAAGCTLDDLVFAEQVHGSGVTVVGGADVGRGATTAADAVTRSDALVTTDRGVGLVVLVADCVPLVLVDPVAGVLGCVHAGWRGTVAGVTTAALAVMATLGAEPARVVVGIGPAVRSDDYEVGDDVADALRSTLAGCGVAGAADVVLGATSGGRWRCDLVAANRIALVGAGVDTANIHAMSSTTSDPGLFSHRRGDGGRFAAIARLGGDGGEGRP